VPTLNAKELFLQAKHGAERQAWGRNARPLCRSCSTEELRDGKPKDGRNAHEA
jgi:hypothetical protein